MDFGAGPEAWVSRPPAIRVRQLTLADTNAPLASPFCQVLCPTRSRFQAQAVWGISSKTPARLHQIAGEVFLPFRHRLAH